LVGAPTSAGAHWPGQERGPRALREAGLLAALEERGLAVADHGDLSERIAVFSQGSRRAQNLDAVVASAHEVAAATRAALAETDVALVLGGDCTITLGVLSGALEHVDSVGLAYVDAHLDLNTPATSPSGVLDSMGLAHALGCGAPPLVELGPHVPLLAPEQVVILGYQPSEANRAELDALAAHAITAFTADAVVGRGREVAEATKEQLRQAAARYLVHADLDVVDFVNFPASDWAQYCGSLTLETAEALVRELVADERCLGLVVTEFNPDRDRGGLAARLVEFVINCATAFVGDGKER
jgi:arginase